jgi:hypothetical protein
MASVLHIDKYVYFQLDIESEQMPPSFNLVGTVSIIENISMATPVLRLTFDDPAALARSLALTEGTRAELLFGKDKETAQKYNFRLFGVKQEPVHSGQVLIATFIVDAPKYLTGVATEAFKGTSATAMGELAQKAGLTYDGPDSTDDYMTWLNVCETRASFAEDMAMHGYVDEHSCMLRALTAKRQLKYKNLTEEIRKPGKFSFLLNTDPSSAKEGKHVLVQEMRDASTGGVMNSWLNYGWNYHYHSLKGEQQTVDKAPIRPNGKYLPINSDVKKEVEDKTRVEYYGRLDCGNTHDNYVKAKYLNMRNLALFSERVHLITPDFTGAELLDPALVEHLEQDGNRGKNSAKYLISAKTSHLAHGSRYAERFELMRASLEIAGNTPLLG